MTQGAAVLAGMTNDATQTTDIDLNGPGPGLSVVSATPAGSITTS